VTERVPLVVFAVGNESRGDDAVGPLLLQRLDAMLPAGARAVLDFQLQVEHALELRDAALALFVDAACGLAVPFAFFETRPGPVPSAFSHALAPEAVLEVFARVEGRPPPPAFVLAIRASRFELGEAPSPAACADLDAALRFAETLLARPTPAHWRAFASPADG
jgi:hydrogenase maturation protease